MSRIACLHIPRFPIVVHQKQNPELKGKPFVLIGGRSRVLFCSQSASRNYVVPGMRLSQARGICAGLLWRDLDPSLCKSAQKELVAEMVAASPRVLGGEPGEFFLDADGLTYTGGEGKFCRELLRLVSKRGYTDGLVGIANCAFAASVAAYEAKHRRWLIVPSGYDIRFLSGLSIDYLPLATESRETLTTLGIETIGQFRQLSIDEIRHKFGVDGNRAYQLASGIDDLRPVLPSVEKSFQCLLDMGGPVESLTDTIFVLKSLLNRLVLQLVNEGICAEEITACFFSDDTLFEERPIRLVKPSNNSKFLLEVLRLSLESKPLKREFTAIKLVISKTDKESWQQLVAPGVGGGSERSEPSSSTAFAYLLQRMETRLGEGALVRPVEEDHYFPELAGNWQPVSLKESRSNTVKEACQGQAYARSVLNGKGVAAGLVFKRYAEPAQALVDLKQETPVALTFNGRWYKVLEITAPERLSGMWWEDPVRKSYYMVMIQSGKDRVNLVLLTYNHHKSGWFVEGVYD